MNILFIGDPHLKITRFDLATQFMNWLNGAIYDLNPDIVVNLGDTFTNHAVMRSEILGIYRDHIDFICGIRGFQYYHILGNHEFFKPNDKQYHALQAMKGLYEEFHVVDERIDLENITMLPYYSDDKQFPLQTKEICICHQDFKEADYGFKKSESVLDPSTISAEIIISGHIHNKQELGKVIYPGSSFSQSIQDVDQVKGLILFDTETYKQQFIMTPLPQWRRLSFEITEKFNTLALHSYLVEHLDDKNHWVIELTGPKSEIIAYLGTKEQKTLCKSRDIKFKTNFTDKQRKMINLKANSIESILSEYVDKIYSGSLDKKLVKDRALSVLSRARGSQ